MQPENLERISRALNIVKDYASNVWGTKHYDDNDSETGYYISDILADMMHLCHKLEIDIDNVIERAKYHFEEECNEEDESEGDDYVDEEDEDGFND